MSPSFRKNKKIIEPIASNQSQLNKLKQRLLEQRFKKNIRQQLTKNNTPTEIANRFVRLIFVNQKELAIKEYTEYFNQFDKLHITKKEIELIKKNISIDFQNAIKKSLKSILKKINYKNKPFSKEELKYLNNLNKIISEELVKSNLIKNKDYFKKIKFEKLDIYYQLGYELNNNNITEVARLIDKIIKNKGYNKIAGTANLDTNIIKLINISPEYITHELIHIALKENNQIGLTYNEFFVEFLTNVINRKLNLKNSQLPKTVNSNNPYNQGIIFANLFYKKYLGNMDKLMDFIYSEEFNKKMDEFS